MAKTFTARVLVVAEEPSAAGAAAARLARLGMKTITAAGDAAARKAAADNFVDAAYIEASDRPLGDAARLARSLREAAHPRMLAIIAVAAPDEDAKAHAEAFDAVLRAPAHPAQAATRIQLVQRLGVMEDEARLRAHTLAGRGIAIDLGMDGLDFRPPQVLFVGDPTLEFLGFERAISGAGGDVVAAFTPFTAFDYLHERDFDAVVINGMAGIEPAFTMCGGMRRNTRLFHVPALILADLDAFPEVDEAFERGASDFLPASAQPAELARRAVSLARERQRREALKIAFTRVRAPELSDSRTGLAAPAFFVEHLDNMARRARSVHRALSVTVMRVRCPAHIPPEEREKALRQLGSMVRHLVRAEDLASRLEPEVFCVVMPGAPLSAALGAAERLEAIAEHTAFDGMESGGPFQVDVRTESAELEPTESGRALLTRAVRGFEVRAKAG